MRRKARPILFFLALLALLTLAAAPSARAEPQHGIAMHGAVARRDPAAPFHYVNPDAPKGGRIVQGLPGTFDSLNPFIVRGTPLAAMRGAVIESLMVRGYDEPFSLYGLLAETVETNEARDFVSFAIHPAARFSDGHPVTAADVLFSWQLLRDKGRPNFRTYYAKVERATALDARHVRFDFPHAGDRELPFILGLMPILPQHATDAAHFEDTTLAPVIGSGPYRVAAVDAGKSVVLRRDPAYWGRDLAVNRGFWNFDEMRFDFYRDDNSSLEAFRRHLYDFRSERDPARWQAGYGGARDGAARIVQETFASGLPRETSLLIFNTRRPLFADARLRRAISLLPDLDWINRNFYFGLFARAAGYFDGSELSSIGRPADADERALLAPFPHAVAGDVLEGRWHPPQSDGSGRDRSALKEALGLFAEAGYVLRDGVLRSKATGAPLAFEILVSSREQERLALAVARDFKRAGISASVRVADAVQFDQRRNAYDFDMIEFRYDQSLSPGNEQAFYWGSAAAEVPGTRNYMGAKNPAIDAAIAALLAARERPAFVSAVRALDRLLISGVYGIPLFQRPAQWVARWTNIERPAQTSLSGYLPETWWSRP